MPTKNKKNSNNIQKEDAKKNQNSNGKVKKKKSGKIKKSTIKKISTIVVLIAILAVIFYFAFKTLKPTQVIATVNDEIITNQELEQKYAQLPDQYKLFITKEAFLDQIINVKLLLQEAKKQVIVISEEEIEAELTNLKNQVQTEEEFDQLLKQRGITLQELENQINEQLTINKLLDETVFSKIEISDSKIERYYEANKEDIKTETGETIPYSEAKEQINQILVEDISNSAIEIYINQLRANAVITKEGEEPTEELPEEEVEKTETTTFTETEDPICKEEDKPIIRLFSTTKNSASNWISETFDSLDQDNIVIYHWQLDTGDNTITAIEEQGIPKQEVEIFQKYNPKSTVPTYVFGCKYVRIGNAYSTLEEEKAEFERVIEQLTN